MSQSIPHSCTAFLGQNRIASGALIPVALAARRALGEGSDGSLLVFDDATGQQIEIDYRGSENDVRERLSARFPNDSRAVDATQGRRAGRPRLGVVGREVTLLPRHWDWLAAQRGGASVALRRLIDEARKSSDFNALNRRTQEAVYRFIHAIAGNLPAFEEVSRALFSGDGEAFRARMENWPADIRDYACEMMLGGKESSAQG